MLTYRTDKKNSYFFRQLLTTIAIVLLPIFYDLLFPIAFIKDTYCWFAAAFILMRVIDATNKDRLIEICFDTDNKQVIFIYKTLFSSSRKMILPYENARLEIDQSKSNWTWLWEPLTLYFLKNKKEVFEIRKSKDGFSVAKLKEISETVENLSLPVKKV